MRGPAGTFCLAGLGLQTLGRLKELHVEMIDCIEEIILLAVLSKGISRVVNPAAQDPAHNKAAGDTDRSQPIQSIGVLNHLGLNRPRLDPSAVAVGLNGVTDSLEI